MKMSQASNDLSHNLPNTIIVGVQKSATTWLSKRLSQHPDIYMAPGEVHYFDHEDKFSKGPEWYASLFKSAGNESIRCEKSGAYFWTTCEGVAGEPMDKPDRIRRLLPNAKLIVILRNPVVRAISGWNHNVRSGAMSSSLDINNIFSPKYAEIVRQHGILTRGLYYQQLSSYLEKFQRDQVQILFFETDILENPAAGLEKTVRFLNADTTFDFQELREAENKLESTKIGVWASYFTKGVTKKTVHKVDRHILRKLPLPKWHPARPTRDIVEQLYDYYEQENVRLSELIGDLPSSWDRPKVLA